MLITICNMYILWYEMNDVMWYQVLWYVIRLLLIWQYIRGIINCPMEILELIAEYSVQ